MLVEALFSRNICTSLKKKTFFVIILIIYRWLFNGIHKGIPHLNEVTKKEHFSQKGLQKQKIITINKESPISKAAKGITIITKEYLKNLLSGLIASDKALYVDDGHPHSLVPLASQPTLDVLLDHNAAPTQQFVSLTLQVSHLLLYERWNVLVVPKEASCSAYRDWYGWARLWKFSHPIWKI